MLAVVVCVVFECGYEKWALKALLTQNFNKCDWLYAITAQFFPFFFSMLFDGRAQKYLLHIFLFVFAYFTRLAHNYRQHCVKESEIYVKKRLVKRS